jgi:predicted nucleotidyltransferase
MAAISESLCRVLDSFPDIRLCIVFGSEASGRASSESDIDIAVAADKPLSVSRRLELTEALAAATHRTVDLVDLQADSGPVLRQALSKGAIIRNRDKTLYARIILRMLLDHADMMPYYDRILRERRVRFLNG